MLTWASVFGLLADSLRAWNDGKWATQNEQMLHFKGSSGHLNTEKLLLHLLLLLHAFSHYYGGPRFLSLSMYHVVFGLPDLWVSSIFSFSMLEKQEVFDVASVGVQSESKVKFGWTFSWNHFKNRAASLQSATFLGGICINETVSSWAFDKF